LHNVGNVITSINVSAGLLSERLRHSRIANLGKSLALLREHRSDLAHFLAEDPKGKMLPGYLETLAEHLAAEHAEMLREIELLNRGIEHVKDIVAVQQSYARQCGLVETLQIDQLVEDAIRMNLGAFERHGVNILREFVAVPPVTVDKSKALQILINLMRNAKYALDELPPARKVLRVSIGPTSAGGVAVTIQDNGVGVTPYNLPRLFDYGFTTKPDGHGFGLHSSALAAREMGGRLTARSDGHGKGAAFCLELPASRLSGQSTNDEHANRNQAGVPS
jgi:C4-dicarboxylate-specific signal transduction histidine kinase